MTNSDLIDLLYDLCPQQQVQQWLEFKLNGIDHAQIGEYISAISNGTTLANKSFGYLVWSVEDNTHNIRGTTFTFIDARHGNQDLELWLRTNLYPKINFEIFKFDCQGKSIVMLRRPTAKGEPVNFQKKPWNMFPNYMNEGQKKNRRKNLITELRTSNKMLKKGTKKETVWVLEIEN